MNEPADRAGDTPHRRARRGEQNVLWVLATTPVTGITTYLLLVLTARAVGPETYGVFGVFWSAAVISGLGVFLPLEQETTRRGSGRALGILILWRKASRTAAIAAGCCGLVALAAWPIYATVVEQNFGLVIAYTVAISGNVMQFPSRGVLAALRRFRDYAAVVILEAVTRVIAVVVLWGMGSSSVVPYALSIGLAAFVSGLVTVVLARRAGSRSVSAGTAAIANSFGQDATRLMAAAGAMQTILNSGTVVAKVLAPTTLSAFAGQLMAAMTLARLPVLVVQSIQATYLSRLAARWNSRDLKSMQSLLLALAIAVLIVMAGLVAGAWTLGPWAMSIVFGSEYVLDRQILVLVALGVGLYLFASITTDAGIALGLHSAIVIAWLSALAMAIVVIIMSSSLTAAATLPLIVGALVAAAFLARPLVRRARGG